MSIKSLLLKQKVLKQLSNLSFKLTKCYLSANFFAEEKGQRCRNGHRSRLLKSSSSRQILLRHSSNVPCSCFVLLLCEGKGFLQLILSTFSRFEVRKVSARMVCRTDFVYSVAMTIIVTSRNYRLISGKLVPRVLSPGMRPLGTRMDFRQRG